MKEISYFETVLTIISIRQFQHSTSKSQINYFDKNVDNIIKQTLISKHNFSGHLIFLCRDFNYQLLFFLLKVSNLIDKLSRNFARLDNYAVLREVN